MTIHLKEARRAPGSEWLKNHPKLLELAYVVTERLFLRVYPLLKRLDPTLVEPTVRRGEELVKGWVFNCQMCGQCVLHSTGMTCPMNCPKNLRNGPCGGVHANGYCEVIPERPCVWVQAWQRSRQMVIYSDELQLVQPPVNRALQNSSSWINMAEGIDKKLPAGWELAATANGRSV